jgi:ATP-binding cassette subfamily B protein
MISMVLLVPLSIATSIQPLLVGQAISFIRQEPTLSFLQGMSLQAGLNLLAGLMLLTIASLLLLQSVQGYLVQKLGQQITADIRDDLFDHVTALSAKFFDRTPVGRLITRLTSDVEALGDVFATGAIGIVSDLFSIVVTTIVMVSLQWQLALLLLLILLPVTGLIIYFQREYRAANYKARDELSALNSTLQENIVGIGIVQLFRREQMNAHLFNTINRRYVKAVDKTIFYDSSISATLEWIALIAIAAVLWLGGWRVMQGSLNVGTLSTFILYAPRLFDPLRQFAEKFTTIQGGFTAIERINDLLNEPIDVRDPDASSMTIVTPKPGSLSITDNTSQTVPDIQTNGHPTGEICFHHVSFGYKPGEYVLHDLDFTIHPGEKVALVGPTGAGKSSIIRLLCRLYDVNEGSILVDGTDIRTLPQSELRRYIGVILQDSFLFAGDVKSNISLGETYDFDSIRDAAERTNVASFIEQLPNGYNTLLRERGTNLSGGQRQLLAFARIAIRNPHILVLDEATASLDVATEVLIQEALDRLLENRTAIIIAHRLSTIRNVDRIFVLKRGRLVESGSHEQLLAQDGLYASLYKLQDSGTPLNLN